MDPLGVLQAVIGLAAYPGGLLLVAAALLFRAAAGLHAGRQPLAAGGVAGMALADVAVALAPLPHSPVESLPPAAGAAPNLAVAVMLLAAALSLAAGGRWDRRHLVAALIALVPLAAIAAGAATLSLPTISVLPAAAPLAARAGAAAALLLTAPLLCDAFGRGAAAQRAVLTAACAILALSLLTPANLDGAQAALAAAAVVAGVAAYGVLLRAAREVVRRAPVVVLGIATLAGVASVAAVAVAR